MNKRGYYNFEDIGMFILCFAIIAIGLGIGIYLFYSHDVDIREQEANVLSDKIVRAIHENGLGDLENFDILEEAGIDKDIINNGNFYLKLEILENEKIIKSFSEGNKNFEVECDLRGPRLPRCNKEEFYFKNYKIKILTGSNQLEKI